MNTIRILLASAAISAFTASAIGAEPPAHSHDHPPGKAATKGSASKAAKEKMAGMDAQMKQMMAMHEKMMAGKTPEERRAMMAEHMKSMRDGMAMMDGSGGGRSGMGMPKGAAPGAGMSHEMMEKRVDMMQQMMKMMMERMTALEPAK